MNYILEGSHQVVHFTRASPNDKGILEGKNRDGRPNLWNPLLEGRAGLREVPYPIVRQHSLIGHLDVTASGPRRVTIGAALFERLYSQVEEFRRAVVEYGVFNLVVSSVPIRMPLPHWLDYLRTHRDPNVSRSQTLCVQNYLEFVSHISRSLPKAGSFRATVDYQSYGI